MSYETGRAESLHVFMPFVSCYHYFVAAMAIFCVCAFLRWTSLRPLWHDSIINLCASDILPPREESRRQSTDKASTYHNTHTYIYFIRHNFHLICRSIWRFFFLSLKKKTTTTTDYFLTFLIMFSHVSCFPSALSLQGVTEPRLERAVSRAKYNYR